MRRGLLLLFRSMPHAVILPAIQTFLRKDRAQWAELARGTG